MVTTDNHCTVTTVRNKFHSSNKSLVPFPTYTRSSHCPICAMTNSGCMTHFISTITPVLNQHSTNAPVYIPISSGNILCSVHQTNLVLSGLPALLHSYHSHIVLQSIMQPLISIGQHYNSIWDFTFSAHNVTTIMSSYYMVWHLQKHSKVAVWDSTLNNDLSFRNQQLPMTKKSSN